MPFKIFSQVTEKKAQKGFTLVEILVVVSIILISVGIAGDLIVSVTRSYTKTRIMNEIEQNGNYVIAKMVNDVKNATTATSTSSDNLTLTTPSGTVVYRAQTVATGCTGGSPGTITRSGVKMTNDACKDGVNINGALFTVTTSNGVTTVSISFTMTQSGTYTANSPYTASQNFNTFVVLRSGN